MNRCVESLGVEKGLQDLYLILLFSRLSLVIQCLPHIKVEDLKSICLVHGSLPFRENLIYKISLLKMKTVFMQENMGLFGFAEVTWSKKSNSSSRLQVNGL